jgi:hypothetical protein
MILDNDADDSLVGIDIDNAFKYEWLKYCPAAGKPNEFPTAAREKAHAAVEKRIGNNQRPSGGPAAQSVQWRIIR